MGDSEKYNNIDDLIDVSEFESEFDDDALTVVDSEDYNDETPIKEKKQLKKKVAAKPKREKKRFSFIKRKPLQSGTFIASMRERFAAFFIDITILFYVYWIYGTLYCGLFMDSWKTPIPYRDWHGLAFHGSFLLICFLYYFLLEGIFLATIGKFICWMSVRRKDNEPASLISTLLRNIIRPIDYIFIFPVVFIMELTVYHQRLGDLIGMTTVTKKFFKTKDDYNVSAENLSSASGRTVTAIIDIAIFLPFLAGYILTWSPDRPGLSMWLLLAFPVAMIAYFMIIEMLTETSP